MLAANENFTIFMGSQTGAAGAIGIRTLQTMFSPVSIILNCAVAQDLQQNLEMFTLSRYVGFARKYAHSGKAPLTCESEIRLQLMSLPQVGGPFSHVAVVGEDMHRRRGVLGQFGYLLWRCLGLEAREIRK